MKCKVPASLLNRRDLLTLMGKGLLASPLLSMAIMNSSCGGSPAANPVPPPPTNDQFLDEIERAIFLYFWEQASSTTGQVEDRAFAAGNDTRTVSSIAATGFGLTALCIADQRGCMTGTDVSARVQATLSFLLNQMPHQNGFFYHFVDMNTGAGHSTPRFPRLIPPSCCAAFSPAVNTFRTHRSWTPLRSYISASTGHGCSTAEAPSPWVGRRRAGS